MKNKTILLTPLLFVSLISLNAYAQKTDFSGNWKINKEHSDFGDLSPNSAPFDIRVTQEKEQVSIERKQKYAGGELDYTEKLGFDGKAVGTSVKADLKRTSSVKWFEVGKNLLEQSSYSNGQQAKETWVLSTDGKTSTIRKEVVMDGEEHNSTYVYDKQ